jgi:predicted N-acetyltransferase YhbS
MKLINIKAVTAAAERTSVRFDDLDGLTRSFLRRHVRIQAAADGTEVVAPIALAQLEAMFDRDLKLTLDPLEVTGATNRQRLAIKLDLQARGALRP